MSTMSASDAAPLPRLGEVFFDVRGSSRSMRLSWYADTGVSVFSIWQGGTCTGTFRLPMEELPRLVDALQRGMPGADPLDSRGTGGNLNQLPGAPTDPRLTALPGYAGVRDIDFTGPVTGDFRALRPEDQTGTMVYQPALRPRPPSAAACPRGPAAPVPPCRRPGRPARAAARGPGVSRGLLRTVSRAVPARSASAACRRGLRRYGPLSGSSARRRLRGPGPVSRAAAVPGTSPVPRAGPVSGPPQYQSRASTPSRASIPSRASTPSRPSTRSCRRTRTRPDPWRAAVPGAGLRRQPGQRYDDRSYAGQESGEQGYSYADQGRAARSTASRSTASSTASRATASPATAGRELASRGTVGPRTRVKPSPSRATGAIPRRVLRAHVSCVLLP